MRGREFIMKDGYSFHVDEASCLQEYENMGQAYKKIFSRCGLKFRAVEAMTGNIGGSKSHEFQVLAASGEDIILSCNQCEYAANVEKAALAELKQTEKNASAGQSEKVKTPGVHTVEDVAKFLNANPQQLVKTLIYKADQNFIATLVRGDRELMEAKLRNVLGCQELTMATGAEIEKVTGGPLGFSGPIGLQIPIYADFEIAGMSQFITGANAQDLHLQNVNLSDFKVKGYYDLRRAVAGDACPHCASGKYEEHRGIEVGQIFYLGTKYSKSMKAVYLDEKGQEQVMIMGTYGIGVSRTAAAAIEQNNDANGMIWPYQIAPFHFHLVSLDIEKEEVRKVSEQFYQQLRAAGIEVLWDDRAISPGMKFKDSDLIGIPYRIVVGARGLKDGCVEIKNRADGLVSKVAVAELVSMVQKIHHENF